MHTISSPILGRQAITFAVLAALLVAVAVAVAAMPASTAHAHDHCILTNGTSVLLVDPLEAKDPSKGAAPAANRWIDEALGAGEGGLHPMHYFVHKGPSGNDYVGNNKVVVAGTHPDCP